MKNFAKNFVKRKEFGIILIVVILSVILTFLSSAFLTVTNIMDFMKSNSVYGIMAVSYTHLDVYKRQGLGW